MIRYIKRHYVRAEFPIISDDYEFFLLKSYEETYYPEKILGTGRAAYIARNYEMINKSRFCIVYYDKTNSPTIRNSGTKIALDYAVKHNRRIIMFPK